MLPPLLQYEELLRFDTSDPRGSYRPTREKLPDIVNRQPGMLPSERAPWHIIEKDIVRLSRSTVEETMNLTAGRAIYDYCVNNGIEARDLHSTPLGFSIGLKFICWTPALFLYPDKITVPYFDMRRKGGLTPLGALFVFSGMHHALRENNPDYEEVVFEVIKLADTVKRSVQVTREFAGLLSYEQMETMVTITQNLWIAVQNRSREKRRRAAGGGGPLFD